MKQKTILFLILIFVAGNLFAQERGFIKVKVPDATNGDLYEYSFALIIGESEYTNGWQRLNGVKNDVPEVKNALEQHGFYVVVKENIKSDDFDKTIKTFIAEYGQKVNSRVIIYYAGHGHTIKSELTSKSMGYVVPVDAPNPAYDKSGFLKKAIDMNSFNNYALQIQAKHCLFMFDACFAGTIFSGRAGVPPAISYKTAKPVRQFITSGDESEVVADESIFREEFVNALISDMADANNDGFLTATELGLYLYTEVSNNSAGTQHPVSGKLKDVTYNKGDFVFVLNQNNNNNVEHDIDDEDITPLVTYGYVKISNYLEGSLYIDGTYDKPANKNKLITKKLSTGKHTIKIKTDNETWQETITIIENQTVKLIAKSNYTSPQQNKNNDIPTQFTDNRDGKVYKIIEIGNQIWMAENLAYKANSGCWAYDNSQSNVVKYGYLYNYETAKNVCPDGYHLPTDDEWKELETELGMTQDDADKSGGCGNIGDQLKSETNWNSNGNGTNESGFNAFAGGFRDSNNSFDSADFSGYWWSATPYGSYKAWCRVLVYYDDMVYRYDYYPAYGFSVRCLRN